MPKTNRILPKNTKPTMNRKQPKRATNGKGNKAVRDDDSSARYGKKPTLAKGDFRGELVIDAKLTPAQKEEILNLARHGAKTPRDADQRVLSIATKGGKLVVRTSSDDLAVAIGKKVHASHKGGKLTVTWGKDEAPARVLWKK